MDALLFKTTHAKDGNQKKVENRRRSTVRRRKARESVLDTMRKLPSNLEISGESMHEDPEVKEPLKPIEVLKKKPPRALILQEWKKEKERQKNASKTKSVFAVRHIKYDDAEKPPAGKENFKKTSTTGNSLKKNVGLKERNVNVKQPINQIKKTNVPTNPAAVEKPSSQKKTQSYQEWKQSQVQPKKTMTRSVSAKALLNKDSAKKPQSEIITRSSANKNRKNLTNLPEKPAVKKAEPNKKAEPIKEVEPSKKVEANSTRSTRNTMRKSKSASSVLPKPTAAEKSVKTTKNLTKSHLSHPSNTIAEKKEENNVSKLDSSKSEDANTSQNIPKSEDGNASVNNSKISLIDLLKPVDNIIETNEEIDTELNEANKDTENELKNQSESVSGSQDNNPVASDTIKMDSLNITYPQEVSQNNLSFASPIIQSIVTSHVEFEPPKDMTLFDFKAANKTPVKNVDAKTSSKPPHVAMKTPVSTPAMKKALLESEEKRTPVSLFKKSVLARTPGSAMRNKRNSLTPNPKNFLSKIEDPVAQRIDSPAAVKKAPSTPPEVTDSVKHFTKIVAVEESKFQASTDKWNKILEEGSVPEQVHGDILAAIGQSHLFTKKRFKQFKELIELHKDKSAEKGALASDLEGFWAMIYFQVEDVHKRFAELETLMNNGWKTEVQPTKPTVVKKKKKPKMKTEGVEVKKKPAKRTDFKKFREQMMSKKQNQQMDFDIIITSKDSQGEGKTDATTKTDLAPEADKASKESVATNEIVTAEVRSSKVAKPRRSLRFVKTEENKAEEFSSDSLDEAEIAPTSMLSSEIAPVSMLSSETVPSAQMASSEKVTTQLRRSARKTPSKYKSVDQIKNPESIACDLFKASDHSFDVLKSGGFSKYLSKSVSSQEGGVEGPVKRDLLPSFDQDLMVFTPTKPVSTSEPLPACQLCSADGEPEDNPIL